eukprot:1159525-Pelagomonas_calceolata.AAC.3
MPASFVEIFSRRWCEVERTLILEQNMDSAPPLICQQEGLVPIVEPEVTLGPGDYSIEETAFWSERVYSHVMRLLNEYDVMLDGILLKPNMCV